MQVGDGFVHADVDFRPGIEQELCDVDVFSDYGLSQCSFVVCYYVDVRAGCDQELSDVEVSCTGGFN